MFYSSLYLHELFMVSYPQKNYRIFKQLLENLLIKQITKKKFCFRKSDVTILMQMFPESQFRKTWSQWSHKHMVNK